MTSSPEGELLPASPSDAGDVLLLTRAVFSAYAEVVPEPSWLRETVADVEQELATDGGLVLRDTSGRLLAAARFSERDGHFWLRRVAVDPRERGQGLAGRLLLGAEEVARQRGHDRLRTGVRQTLVDVQACWLRRGFHVAATRDPWVELERRLPVAVTLPTAEDTQELGGRVAGLLRAGDLVLLSGDLGAGKTTLARGLGSGLGVRGPVTSPTFVIARVHPSMSDGPALVHVDAYRLDDLAEVDDLDLDASLDESVTVVEWGEGKVEGLAQDRLQITLRRGTDVADETRTASLRPVGPRWADVDLAWRDPPTA